MTFFSSCGNIIIMKEIINILYENGYEAYVVGGFVRDYLLGIESKDIDICTNAPIKEIKRLFKGRGKSFDKFFAYHIEEDGYTYDITTYRKELKYKKNKPIELEVAEDLGTDLLRRDFTINTFAINKDGLFVDMLGAKRDLDEKIIRVVGDTTKKFNEDKTRIIRALRFACTLDFDLDPKIVDFITKRKTYLLNEVPLEYKKSELDKIFNSNGVDKFFYILKQYNISNHFNIEFDTVNKAYNKYGVWAQIKTDLPFSNKEKVIIDAIRSLIAKDNVTFVDLSTYSDDIIYNAVTILGLQDKYQAYKDIISLHSIIEINAEPDLFLKYAGIKNIKKAYKMVERSIMEGYLYNDKESIEKYLRNIRL